MSAKLQNRSTGSAAAPSNSDTGATSQHRLQRTAAPAQKRRNHSAYTQEIKINTVKLHVILPLHLLIACHQNTNKQKKHWTIWHLPTSFTCGNDSYKLSLVEDITGGVMSCVSMHKKRQHQYDTSYLKHKQRSSRAAHPKWKEISNVWPNLASPV